jgi:hypothetical protein
MASNTVYPKLTGPNTTRVLKLFPKLKNHKGTGNLHGQLIEIDLDNPPIFDAVSYVWGKRLDQGKISAKYQE